MSTQVEQRSGRQRGLRHLFDQGVHFLAAEGLDSPRLEAEMLLAHLLECSRTDLYANDRFTLDAQIEQAYWALLRRRAQREPMAYIIGVREFYDRPFAITPEVLIPRPETELLIDLCRQRFQPDVPLKVLEVGAGSGIIPITLGRYFPQLECISIDVSEAALKVAKNNESLHRRQDWIADGVSIQWRRMDILDASPFDLTPAGWERFDLLISNPPYIAQDQLESLQEDVIRYEPLAALLGGADGLDIIDKLINLAPSLLNKHGWLIVEIGADQGVTSAQRIHNSPLQLGGVVPDLQGLPRVLCAQHPATAT